MPVEPVLEAGNDPLPLLRSLLQNLGGHEAFPKYQAWFRHLYCSPASSTFDVLGRRVVFDTYPTLDDCAHVCYGGTEGHAYQSAHWKQKRAERIAWIKIALTRPNKVHPDENIRTNHKYLLYVPPENPEQEAEYYMAIVRVLNPKTVAFLTAYDINVQKFEEFGKIGPRIYPPPKPKKKKR